MPVHLQGGSSDHEDEARIEVVPLIDIMFFLLASFMLVSLSMTHINRVKVNLPVSSSAVAENKTPPIHLAIDAYGVITWDTAVMTPSEVTDKLLAIPPTDETSVMIAADEETRHKQVMAVMDAVRAAHISKVSFETKAPNQ
ncbi:biopolymer transporter ExbD [Luteolibacter pohnpeiensis]|uniref:Biopolymer transporter ExbD n=1 Tax=Luteolibacter pohnpeiensis TaxID=454153 RepID=A0A934VQ27_9BACT|nr:biopolymer transporter ExbD [Luteolibacter pohnpeiensis]MBK1881661.1 biopolymer transporter ExbD [Luteolibacter pohnpeiensis]